LKTRRIFTAIICILLASSILNISTVMAQTSASANLQSHGTIIVLIPSPSPSPSPSPTPTPTATPTPTPTATPTNLAPIPQGWSTATNGMHYAVGGVANVILDSNVKYNSVASIRDDPVGNTDNYAREVNGPYLSIKPGDHIIFSCWIKTSASSLGDKSATSGGRIGIDFYGGGRITGSASPDGAVWTPSGGWPNNEHLLYV